MTKTVQGARRLTLKGSITGDRPYIDLGEWTESNDMEVTSDPEFDRGSYGEGQTPLPAQFEYGERELTRTFDLPRDRDLLRTVLAFTQAGGGFLELQDQYLEPRTRAAFDTPIVTNGQLGGFMATGANIMEPNGKAQVQLTLVPAGMPTA